MAMKKLEEIRKRCENAKEMVLTGANMAISVYEDYCKTVPFLLDELERYKQLEADGRLKELPCKVGDTIFRIDTDESVTDSIVESYIVDSFVFCEDGEVLVRYDTYGGVICTANNLTDKTPYLDYYLCFLSHEEAEAALASQEVSE